MAYTKRHILLLASMSHRLHSLWQMSYSRFFNIYIFLFSCRWALIVFWQLKGWGVIERLVSQLLSCIF